MITETANNGAGAIPLQSASFERFAGVGAILADVVGLLYAVAFITVHNNLLSGLFLTLLGLFSTVALTAVYGRLRHTDASFALLALLLGIAGAWALRCTAATTWRTPSTRRPSSPTRTRSIHVACSPSARRALPCSSSPG